MIRYQIRSIALLNIVNDVKAGRLVPDPYFQRNLVWRDVHKRDFIDTILHGYPFPQMFFSRGKIDVEQMKSVAAIVDGQQRTSAIVDFIDNKFAVNGRYFRELEQEEKADFFKYEVGVVELDLSNEDPAVTEIFSRVNRTSNSLTTIEKLASAYAPTEYMFVARLLADDLEFPKERSTDGEDDEEDLSYDPNTPAELFEWAKRQEVHAFSNETQRLNVFAEREIARRVHVMYVLNIMSTLLSGFFNRNERTLQLLEDYKDLFSEKDDCVRWVNEAAKAVAQLKLPSGSFWANKANFFSLMVAVANTLRSGKGLNADGTREKLIGFGAKPDPEYALAAREGVNNKKQRGHRNGVVLNLLVTR